MLTPKTPKTLSSQKKNLALAIGFILDRDASKQIRPCTGSGAPAQNILTIETQTDFK